MRPFHNSNQYAGHVALNKLELCWVQPSFTTPAITFCQNVCVWRRKDIDNSSLRAVVGQ